MIDPVKIIQWRQKAAEGTLTEADMIEAIKIIRQGRISAAQAASASKSRAKKVVEAPSAGDLLGELEGL